MIKIVTSLDERELHPYRTLRRPMDHLREGIFVAEGEKVVRRLLSSEHTVISLLLTQEWFDSLRNDGAFTARAERFTVFVATKALVESIVGYNLHQGIMAIGRVPPEPSLDALIDRSSRPHLFAAIDGLVSAENVGVVTRNCAAFGVDAIIVGETSSSPYLRRAVRNSMGTVFGIPILHPPRLMETLLFLRENCGMSVVAAHPHGENAIYGADFSRDLCIVLGNEGDGISPGILSVCTERIAIPMMRGTDSLNVASASAVFLYEIRRQRTRGA